MRDKIVIIGAAILDVLAGPVSEEVFQKGSYSTEHLRMSPGGDALNEATVLAMLGKRVELQTVLGDDMQGDIIQAHCKKCGIHLPEQVVCEDMVTGVNVVLVQENGERSFLTNPKGSLRKLRLQHISMPFSEDTQILCLASIFVSPKLGNEELKQIFSQAKAQGILVCADMTKPKQGETLSDMKEVFSLLDYLIPNEQEACMVTQTETVEEAAEAFYRAGVSNVIVKCGAKGCYIRNQEMQAWIPAVPGVPCVDTTGAGDSFAAGFLYGLSEGYPLCKCAEYANQCGAKAISVVGATDWICSK